MVEGGIAVGVARGDGLGVEEPVHRDGGGEGQGEGRLALHVGREDVRLGLEQGLSLGLPVLPDRDVEGRLAGVVPRVDVRAAVGNEGYGHGRGLEAHRHMEGRVPEVIPRGDRDGREEGRKGGVGIGLGQLPGTRG